MMQGINLMKGKDEQSELILSKSLMEDSSYIYNRTQAQNSKQNFMDNYSSVTSTIVMQHVCIDKTYKIDYSILNEDLFQEHFSEPNSDEDNNYCDVGSNNSEENQIRNLNL